MQSTLVEKFKGKVLKEHNFQIIFHRDADGCCAAAIFAKTLNSLQKNVEETLALEYDEFEKLHKLKNNACLVILDLNVDNDEKIAKHIVSRNAIIVDHHALGKDLNSRRCVMIKPQLISNIEPSSYVASKLTFDLCMQLANISKFSWIASIGIIGDFNYKTWKEFVNTSAEKAHSSVSELEKIADIINATAVVAPKDFSELFSLFVFADNPKQIIKSRFAEYLKTVEKEKNYWLKRFEKEAKCFSDIELFLFEINPKFRIKSEVIDELTKCMPNKTIVILEDLNDGIIRFSARRQDFKVKMNEMLKEAIEGIPNASAGGHIPAAAGRIPRKYKGKFLENLVRYLKERIN